MLDYILNYTFQQRFNHLIQLVEDAITLDSPGEEKNQPDRAVEDSSKGSNGEISCEGKISDLQVVLSEYIIVDGKEEMVLKEPVSPHNTGPEKISFAEVVSDGTTFVPVPSFEVKDGVVDIEIPNEVFEDVEPLWRNCVVGYFMGDSPFIGSIHSIVNKIWSSPTRKSKIDV